MSRKLALLLCLLAVSAGPVLGKQGERPPYLTPALEGNYNRTSSRYITPVDGIRTQFPAAQVTFTPGTKFLRTPTTIPASAYHIEDGKPGVTAVCFNTKDVSGAAAVTRVEGQIGPAAGAPPFMGNRLPEGVATSGDFSARWTGFLKADESTQYSRAINGAGAVRVWVDGKAVIDDWVERAAGRGFAVDPSVAAARSTVVTLEKGKDSALKVEFLRTAAAATAAAGVSVPLTILGEQSLPR